jgi:hypothetical protein
MIQATPVISINGIMHQREPAVYQSFHQAEPVTQTVEGLPS